VRGEIATCTGERFERALEAFVSGFAVAAPARPRGGTQPRGKRIDMPDPLAEFLIGQCGVIGVGHRGELQIACPWSSSHSCDSGPSETVYFPAGTGGFTSGNFICLHASCAGRTVADFEAAIGYSVAHEFAELVEPNGAAEEGRRFRAVPAGEFASGPAPTWLVKGVLPQAALAVIYGASGAGKSFFALDLVAAVALGQPWRGLKVRQANVLYIAAEGAGGFRSRVKAYQHANEVEFGPALQVIAGQPSLLTAADPSEIIAEALRIDAGLVVVDTLAQTTPGGDENSAVDMGKALKQCRRLHDETGATVVLIHHAGKDAARGACKLCGTCT
jgi:hypothetical protein